MVLATTATMEWVRAAILIRVMLETMVGKSVQLFRLSGISMFYFAVKQ
jgi:hypothetical protein